MPYQVDYYPITNKSMVFHMNLVWAAYYPEIWNRPKCDPMGQKRVKICVALVARAKTHGSPSPVGFWARVGPKHPK